MFWECVCNKAFSDMASLHSSLTCLTVSFLVCFITLLYCFFDVTNIVHSDFSERLASGCNTEGVEL